jgi:hypothetical protein
MMADFHDSAQCAGEALAAAASVEVEARSTGGGPVPCGSATPQAATRGGRPVRLRCSLSDSPPSWRSEDTIAVHETPSCTHPLHEGCIEGGGSGEDEGAPRPATTDEARSYLDLLF